jgi:MFS family permease
LHSGKFALVTIAPELRQVLGSARFRQLFTVRATGQFCDGLFQAALATFVLFSPERQPTAASIATTFAILYLPYSIVGPFAGVFLDRWRRRQVLLYGNLLRTVVVLGVALLTIQQRSGLDLGLAVLIALGINRFILAALSSSLPHTVADKDLVTANAFSPTAGTLFAAIGGLVRWCCGQPVGGGDAGSTTILVLSALGFTASGLLALRMPKDLLGPDGSKPGDTFAAVIRGFAEGATALWRARPANARGDGCDDPSRGFRNDHRAGDPAVAEHPEPTQRT